MLQVAVLSVLLAQPAFDVASIRDAIRLARAPAAERQAALAPYVARFPLHGGEDVAAIEVFTPFRDVVERGVREIAMNNNYSESRAEQEWRQSPAAVRVQIHVALPYGTVPLDNTVSFGESYAVTLLYRTRSGRQVTVRPRPRVSTTCLGMPCYMPDLNLTGAVLETFVPLAGPDAVDARGSLSVLVRRPDGRQRIANFELGRLR